MKLPVAFLVLFIGNTVFGQIPTLAPAGGGEYRMDAVDDISPEQRVSIINMLNANKARLQKSGKWEPPVLQATLFDWPLAKAPGFTENGYYGIANYVDENVAFPNQVQDYNCGNRSYDLSSGYNHRGTDISLWPFAWDKMAKNQVYVVAAASGTIIGKSDGNFDQNCAFCTIACDWNAVYVRHADGSVAWYGHMKSGTPTSKNIGDFVVKGEYLGVVGSSGNSTAPHLHFEVWTSDSYTKLVDPWAGACNLMNGSTSWWANQQPYRVSTLNLLKTHGTAPQTGNCPAAEAVNGKTDFVNGDTLFLGTYYRDQISGQTVTHRLRRPDNTLYANWNQPFTQTFSFSWWYYFFILPANSPTGVWKYEVVYDGNTFVIPFAVNIALKYRFTGNGNFSNPANWDNGKVPPSTVPAGVEIIITNTGSNECVADVPVTFSPGSTLTVSPGSKLKSAQNLILL